MSKMRSYITIDYYRDLKQKAYNENESFDDFVERIAEKYFPGRGEEWRKRYAFSLHFYGLCVAACQDCQGVCPHHGHRYSLRIKAGSAVPIPYASLELCPKFKAGIDRQGRTYKRQELVEPEPEAEDFSFPEFEPQLEQSHPWSSFSHGSEVQPKSPAAAEQDLPIAQQQDLFALEAEDEGHN